MAIDNHNVSFLKRFLFGTTSQTTSGEKSEWTKRIEAGILPGGSPLRINLSICEPGPILIFGAMSDCWNIGSVYEEGTPFVLKIKVRWLFLFWSKVAELAVTKDVVSEALARQDGEARYASYLLLD